MPRIIPWRRRSKGSAASSTTSSVAAAPEARKPAPIQPSSVSDVASSAATTITRRQRPARIQSSAIVDGLRRARARRVDLRVRAARADQLGELRVAHGQDAEQEPAVERVGLLLEQAAEVVDAPVDLGERDLVRVAVVEHPVAQRLQRGQPLAVHAVDRVAGDLVGHLVEAGEGGGEDHAGVVAQRVGQPPAVGELGALRGRAVVLHEREAGVAQGVDAGADGQLCLASQGLHALGVDIELLRRSKAPARAASLITSSALSIVSKRAVPSSPLTSRVMCLSSISRRRRPGMTSMPCSPASRRATFASSKSRSAPGSPSAAPVMTTGAVGRTLAFLGRARQLATALQELGEQTAEIAVGRVVEAVAGRCRRGRGGPLGSRRGCAVAPACSVPESAAGVSSAVPRPAA